MTEEQIKAWQRREFVQTAYDGGWPLPNQEAAHGEPLLILPKAIVVRLLEERRRLLAALKHFAPVNYNVLEVQETSHPIHGGYGGCSKCDAADASLAYAEERLNEAEWL